MSPPILLNVSANYVTTRFDAFMSLPTYIVFILRRFLLLVPSANLSSGFSTDMTRDYCTFMNCALRLPNMLPKKLLSMI